MKLSKNDVVHLGCNSSVQQYGLGTDQVRGQLCRKGVGGPSGQVRHESVVCSCCYEGQLHPGLC